MKVSISMESRKQNSKMKIAGLQKVTTIDYPGKIACTIFLYGCNFRCGFCHNPDLVTKKFEGGFSEEEILEFLEKRFGKLDAVCFTGGEPLMTIDFDFVKKIKDLGYKIKMDTNGVFPDRLSELIDKNLVDYIAMDIKGTRENYSEVAGVIVDIEKIEKSIKKIHEFGNYEFRTTIVNKFHSINSMVETGKWLNKICGGRPKEFFLQGFKKDGGEMIDPNFLKEENISEEFLKELKENINEFFEEVEVRI